MRPKLTPSPAEQLSLLSLRGVVSYKLSGPRKGREMKRKMWIVSIWLSFSVVPAIANAQAFGEYGRAVGSIPHGRSIGGSSASGGGTQGNVGSGGVGDIGGRKLPARLVVSVKSASLFPRQDEESEKIVQLAQGVMLVPMVQSEGGSDWYMVKTPKGLVGWIKSSDVRPEKITK